MAHQQAQPRKTYAAVSSLEVFHTGGPVRLSPDGLFVATACVEAVSVVEVATGKVMHTLEGDTEPITALAWSKGVCARLPHLAAVGPGEQRQV